jgi:hypothetical protein
MHLGEGWEVGCGCHSGRTAPFWVAGLGECRRLAGTTSGSLQHVSLGHLRTQPRPARPAQAPQQFHVLRLCG